MSFARATLVEAFELGTRLRRMVLDVPDLDTLDPPDVADAAVGVYFPEPGARHARHPEEVDGAEGRNYSLRYHDADARRLTVDVVLHARGLGTDWARRAEPGDSVMLGHARSWYHPEPTADWHLLVADLAGLPALARIIDESRSRTQLVVIAEVLDAAELDYLPARADVTVIPLVGTGNGAAPSRLAAAVSELTAPPGRGYCWFAGEAAETRTVRKHLRAAGWTRDQIDAVGYWRADSEDWDRRFAAVGSDLVDVYTRAIEEGRGEKAASEEYDEALERAGL
jgi:NADPH-dependent ferric siderophore reductase